MPTPASSILIATLRQNVGCIGDEVYTRPMRRSLRRCAAVLAALIAASCAMTSSSPTTAGDGPPSPSPSEARVLTSSPTPRATTPPREDVTFKSGDLTLKGWLWRPAGTGPFPAVLWNHGSGQSAEQSYFPQIWPTFVRAGYVLFAPFRRGQGGSEGTWMDEVVRAAPVTMRSKLIVQLHETDQLSDQLAGLAFLRTLPYVDTSRIAVMGWSYGGIQAILGAEADPGYRAAVDCAGAALSWESNADLRDRLVRAVAKIRILTFILQAENDASTGPTRALSAEFARIGKPYKATIYPPWQRKGPPSEIPDGHLICGEGADVWGPDVLAFLAGALR